jgi:hypothetical protein
LLLNARLFDYERGQRGRCDGGMKMAIIAGKVFKQGEMAAYGVIR